MFEENEQNQKANSIKAYFKKKWMPIRKYRKTIGKIMVVLITIIALLYGQGLLLKPKIVISCGAIDLRIPPSLSMTYMMMQLLTFSKDVKEEIGAQLDKKLREYGLTNEKIDIVIDYWPKINEGKASLTDIDLEDHEKNILWMALLDSLQGSASSLASKSLIPDAVLFFEVANSGRISAKKAHIIVRLAGSPYDSKIDSDNKILFSECSTGQFVCDLESIAPKSSTKGILWFNKSGNRVENQIVITYEQGTTRQKFEVDKFYLSRK